MGDRFEVVVAAGNLRSDSQTAVHFPHRWTEQGVNVEAGFTGAHVLHLSVAGCVLNDLYREAANFGIQVDGVRVLASGGFDDRWPSTGITYTVEVSSSASDADVARVIAAVDDVAEIPRAIRAGAPVRRIA
jgi:uncharacterized OsmC-like protein